MLPCCTSCDIVYRNNALRSFYSVHLPTSTACLFGDGQPGERAAGGVCRYGIQEEAAKVERARSEQLMRQISPQPFKVAARPRQLFEDAAERVVVL